MTACCKSRASARVGTTAGSTCYHGISEPLAKHDSPHPKEWKSQRSLVLLLQPLPHLVADLHSQSQSSLQSWYPASGYRRNAAVPAPRRQLDATEGRAPDSACQEDSHCQQWCALQLPEVSSHHSNNTNKLATSTGRCQCFFAAVWWLVVVFCCWGSFFAGLPLDLDRVCRAVGVGSAVVKCACRRETGEGSRG